MSYNVLWFRVLVVLLLIFILIGVENNKQAGLSKSYPACNISDPYKEIIEDAYKQRELKETLNKVSSNVKTLGENK